MRMPPDPNRFQPLCLADRSRVEKAVRAAEREACEFSFANLMIWQDFDRPSIGRVNGRLCIRIHPINEPSFFLEPLGGLADEVTIDACLLASGCISRARAAFVERLPEGRYEITSMRAHFDYLYRTQELAEFAGRRYDGKRNHIRGFMRRCPDVSYEDLRAEHASEAMNLFDQWRDARGGTGACEGGFCTQRAACQERALTRAFASFDALGFFGGMLRMQGRMAAFLMASSLSDLIACVPLEYHDPGLPGIVPMLFREFARRVQGRVPLLNLEQDLGIEGLRRHKMSYHPERLVEKYEVRLRNARQEDQG
jgi:hypothetical protein